MADAEELEWWRFISCRFYGDGPGALPSWNAQLMGQRFRSFIEDFDEENCRFTGEWRPFDEKRDI